MVDFSTKKPAGQESMRAIQIDAVSFAAVIFRECGNKKGPGENLPRDPIIELAPELLLTVAVVNTPHAIIFPQRELRRTENL